MNLIFWDLESPYRAFLSKFEPRMTFLWDRSQFLCAVKGPTLTFLFTKAVFNSFLTVELCFLIDARSRS